MMRVTCSLGVVVFVCLFASSSLCLAQMPHGEPMPPPVIVEHNGEIASSVAVVTVLTSQGKPAPGVMVRSRLLTAGQEPMSMVQKTDEEGQVKIEDLPVSRLSQIAFRFEHWGIELATTRSIKLSDQGGVSVEFVLPKKVEDPNAAVIRSLRTVFERKGAEIVVFQYFTLGTLPGTIFRSGNGFPIPLPKGARGARPIDEEGVALRFGDGVVYFDSAISESGLDVAIAYDISIDGETAHFEQLLPCAISVAQFISTWTAGDVSMSGRNIPDASVSQLGSGVAGLVTVGRDIADGRLEVTLTGLTEDERGTRRLVAAFMSIGLLMFGLLILVRRKLGSKNKNAQVEA